MDTSCGTQTITTERLGNYTIPCMMRQPMMKYFLAYLAFISLAAVIMTVSDKSAAKKGKRRVPEKTLFITAILGGSAAMYLTMLAVRHKTKHKRFMIGLPLIAALQIISIYFLLCRAAA